MQGNCRHDVMVSKPRRRLSIEDRDILTHLSQTFSSLEENDNATDIDNKRNNSDKCQGAACSLAAALETMRLNESEISVLLEATRSTLPVT